MNSFCAFTVLFLFIGGLKFLNVNCWKTKREGKEIFYYISLIEEVITFSKCGSILTQR